MAAALTKTRRLNVQPNHFLRYLPKTSGKHSISNPVAAKTNIVNHQLQQSKQWFCITHPAFPKPKEVYYRFFSTASSSSQKSGLVGWYLSVNRSRPVVTKSITSALIYTAADLSSQTIVGENSKKGYDLMRTLRMAGYGLLIVGPSMNYWYNFMSRVFPKRDLLSTFKKITLGQMTYGPAMTVVFFSLNAALQGEHGSEICARLKRDLLPTMINGIMYWPVCDFVTFKFIPVHLQPLVTSSFAYLWTVYMTYMASLEKVKAT